MLVCFYLKSTYEVCKLTNVQFRRSYPYIKVYFFILVCSSNTIIKSILRKCYLCV